MIVVPLVLASIILSTVLVGVGIPEAGIALILGIDRILDMCRTSINVLGDIVTCTVVDSLTEDDESQEDLPEIESASLPRT